MSRRLLPGERRDTCDRCKKVRPVVEIYGECAADGGARELCVPCSRAEGFGGLAERSECPVCGGSESSGDPCVCEVRQW